MDNQNDEVGEYDAQKGKEDSKASDAQRGKEDYIVKSAVREAVEGRVASDFYPALNQEIDQIIQDAARRAEENDRKTVLPRDL